MNTIDALIWDNSVDDFNIGQLWSNIVHKDQDLSAMIKLWSKIINKKFTPSWDGSLTNHWKLLTTIGGITTSGSESDFVRFSTTRVAPVTVLTSIVAGVSAVTIDLSAVKITALNDVCWKICGYTIWIRLMKMAYK